MSCDRCADQAEEAMCAAGVPPRQAHAAWAEGAGRGPRQGASRRLVLVDPESDAYNWEHVAELERITGDRFIAAALRAGWQIYDLWQDEWDDLVRGAGYDSIATVSIEGPEEYELSTFDEG